MRFTFSFKLITALFLCSSLSYSHIVHRREICLEDGYLQGLQNEAQDATPFCSTYLGIPLVTKTVRTVTPTVTEILTISTTRFATVRTRGTTTETFTSTTYTQKLSKRDSVKRNATPQPTEEVFDYKNLARRADSQNITLIQNALSSACSCLGVKASTTRVVATASPSVRTLTAFDITSKVITQSRIFSVTAYATITVVGEAPNSYGPSGESSFLSGPTSAINSTGFSPVSTNSTSAPMATASTASSSGNAGTRTGLLPPTSAPFANVSSTIDSATGHLPTTIPALNSTAASAISTSASSEMQTMDTRTGLLPSTTSIFNSTVAPISLSQTGCLPPNTPVFNSSAALPTSVSVRSGTGTVGTRTGLPPTTMASLLNSTGSAAIIPSVDSTTRLRTSSSRFNGTRTANTKTGLPTVTNVPFANSTALPSTASAPNSTTVLPANASLASGTGYLPTTTILSLNSTGSPSTPSILSSTTALSTSGTIVSGTVTANTRTVPTPSTTIQPMNTVVDACISTSIVTNGGFETHDGTASTGWFEASDGDIQFLNVAGTATDPTHGGERQALIRTISNTDSVTLIEELPLCPNTTYDFSAWTRSPTLAAGCEVLFALDGYIVGAKLGATTTTDFEEISGTYGPAQGNVTDLVAYLDCSNIGYGTDVGKIYLDDITLVPSQS